MCANTDLDMYSHTKVLELEKKHGGQGHDLENKTLEELLDM